MSNSNVIAATLAAALLSALPLSGGRAQDYPGLQQLYGTVDNDSLIAECDPPEGGSMHCSFSQVTVSRGGDDNFEAELAGRIDEIVKEERERRQQDGGKTCERLATMADAMRTGETPPKDIIPDPDKYRAGMAKMTPEAKAETVAMLADLAAFCRAPSKASAEQMLRAQQDMERRTCKIWTHRYEQTFASTDGGQTWISSGGPAGAGLFPECGVIVIAKLQKAKDGDGHFWVYSSRRIVTDKDAKLAGGGTCSELDEREYLYDWKSETTFLGCDYIKFGF